MGMLLSKFKNQLSVRQKGELDLTQSQIKVGKTAKSACQAALCQKPQAVPYLLHPFEKVAF
ncbi:hypothetical protein LBC_01420 [Campylobacter sp. 19-13652]|nr:hypothetical protein LBC_01420 [Campylobacter sp. 19-13652]